MHPHYASHTPFVSTPIFFFVPIVRPYKHWYVCTIVNYCRTLLEVTCNTVCFPMATCPKRRYWTPFFRNDNATNHKINGRSSDRFCHQYRLIRTSTALTWQWTTMANKCLRRHFSAPSLIGTIITRIICVQRYSNKNITIIICIFFIFNLKKDHKSHHCDAISLFSAMILLSIRIIITKFNTYFYFYLV